MRLRVSGATSRLVAMDIDLSDGPGVMQLDALLRRDIPALTGWGYSFTDGTLEVDLPDEARAYLSEIKSSLKSYGDDVEEVIDYAS